MSAVEGVRTGVLFGLGNPLLDISVEAKDTLFEKYALKTANAILAEEKHLGLYTEITSDPYKPEYVAGGSCQNTIRVAQWMLQSPNASTFAGCVGVDANANTLRSCAEGDGVRVEYLVQDKVPTGTCAVLIKDKDRSMVANLAAANAYKADHLKEDKVAKIWQNADFFFVEGYFLTVAVDAILTLAEHASSNGKTFALSLSAPFICEFFNDPLMRVLKHANLVFGNETEAETIAKKLGWADTTPRGVAQALSTKLELAGSGQKRVSVITCGASDVVVASGDDVVTYKVPTMDSADIVDTNGAGDAFAGGFLAALVKGKDVKECVRAGTYSAQVILRTSGTKLEGKPAFKW